MKRTAHINLVICISVFLNLHELNALTPGQGLFSPVLAGTGITGEVSGSWTKEHSPYMVHGDIVVPKGQLLTNGNIFQHPVFADSLNHDFTLLFNSPYINAASYWGYGNFPKRDITGEKRPDSPGIGTFEYTKYATSLHISELNDSTGLFKVKKPKGTMILVVACENEKCIEPRPADSVTYNDNWYFGKGDTVNQGWYSIYYGPDSVFVVTGFKPGAKYHVQCINVLGTKGNERYIMGESIKMELMFRAGTASNTPPYLKKPLHGLLLNPGETFILDLQAYFSDSSASDTLSFAIENMVNSPMPNWAVFDTGENKLVFCPATCDADSQINLIVTVTDKYAEEIKDTLTVCIQQEMGLFRVEDPGISIYPLPACSILNISVKNLDHYISCLYNSQGIRVMREEYWGPGLCTLPVGHLPPGAYVICIVSMNIIYLKQKIYITH
jgi:hypothetical protein